MPAWLSIFLLTAGALFGLKLFYIAATAAVLPLTRGALYVSTARVRIDAFLASVHMSAGELLVDLGCGDGRVLRRANERYGVRGIGYELNLMAYLKARLLCRRYPAIRLRMANFWRADVSCADVVYCYLYPDVLRPLALKLKQELKPGAVVATGNFPLPGWRPIEVVRCGRGLYGSPIYIYRNEPCNKKRPAIGTFC